MNYGEKKAKNVVLNLASSLPGDLVSFLEELRMKITTPDASFEKFRMKTVLVDANSAKYTDILRDLEIESSGVRVVFIGEVENLNQFVLDGGWAVLDVRYLLVESYRRIWTDLFLMNESSVHLDESKVDQLEEVQSFHITNHFTSGYYSDLLVSIAAQKGFNYVLSRNFYSYVASYMNLLRENKISTFPVDVEYGYSNSEFMIRFVCSVNSFSRQFITSALHEPEFMGNVSSHLLSLALDSVNHLEISYFEVAQKIAITGTIVKHMEMENQTRSLFVTDIAELDEVKIAEPVLLKPAEVMAPTYFRDGDAGAGVDFEIDEVTIRLQAAESYEEPTEEQIESEADDTLFKQLVAGERQVIEEEINKIQGFDEGVSDDIATIASSEQSKQEKLDKISDKLGLSEEVAAATFEDMIDDLVELQKKSFGKPLDVAAEEIRRTVREIDQEKIVLKATQKKLSEVSQEKRDEVKKQVKEKIIEERIRKREQELKDREIAKNEAMRKESAHLMSLQKRKNPVEEETEQSLAAAEDAYNDEQKVADSGQIEGDSQTVRGGPAEKEEANVIKGGPAEKEEANVIKGGPAEKEEANVIKGGPAEKEEANVIKGGPAEKEEAKVIKGGPIESEKAQIVSGGAEEKEEMQIISGGEEKKENQAVAIRDLFKEIIVNNLILFKETKNSSSFSKIITKEISKFHQITNKEVVAKILTCSKEFMKADEQKIIQANENQIDEYADSFKNYIKENIPDLNKEEGYNFVSPSGELEESEGENAKDLAADQKLNKVTRERDYWKNQFNDLKTANFKKENRSESALEMKQLEQKKIFLEKQLDVEKRKSAQLVENLKAEKDKVQDSSEFKKEVLRLRNEVKQAENLQENMKQKAKEAEQKIQYYQNEIGAMRDSHEQELEVAAKKAKIAYERALAKKQTETDGQDDKKEQESRKKAIEMEKKNRDLEQQLAKTKILLKNAKAGDRKDGEAAASRKLEILDKQAKKTQEMLSTAQRQNTELKKQNSKMKIEATGLKNKLNVVEKELARFKKRRAG